MNQIIVPKPRWHTKLGSLVWLITTLVCYLEEVMATFGDDDDAAAATVAAATIGFG